MTSFSPPTTTRSGATRRLPLFRSGHILVANSAMTALVGFAFWVVAARLYSPAVVGSNATAVSAMLFLAGVAQLNLMSVLLRFVPTAGPRAGALVARAYVTGAALSAVAAVVFVAGMGIWAPDLRDTLRGPTAAAFVLVTAAWSIFVMQDNVLVGVQKPGVVAIENLLFSLVKLALLVPAAVWLADTGIWYAWAAASVIAVVAVTTYLFRRAIPRFAEVPVSAVDIASRRALLGYLVPDYVGSLAWIAGTSLVPVLVLDLTDTRHAAAFALAWQVGFTLFAVPAAFGQSLVAHGATQTTTATADHRRVRAHVLMLVAPVALAVIVVAPYLLRLFGPWYEHAGTTTLRLIAAASIPNVVVALAVSHARVTREMRVVVLTLVGLSVVVLGGTVMLVPRVGIAGAGWAWVTGELVVAGAVLVRPVLAARLIRTGSGGVSADVVARVVAERYPDWTVERGCPTVSDSAVVFVRNQERPGVVKMSSSASGRRLLDCETRVLTRLHTEDQPSALGKLLPARLRHTDADGLVSVLDERLPGTPGRVARSLTPAAFAAIAPLHRMKVRTVTVTSDVLTGWVSEPARAVRAALDARGLAPGPVERIVDELADALSGRALDVGWVHGDFHPGNVLVERGRVTGVIDWSQASEADPAELDLAFWLLTTNGGRGSLGQQVARRLRSDSVWTADESALLNDARQLPPRAALLLTWLRHVNGNLGKSDRYARSTVWWRRTVVPVLAAVQR